MLDYKAVLKGVFRGMFKDCTDLTKATALQAERVLDSSYYQMFSGCTKLTDAPNIMVKEFNHAVSYLGACEEMFKDCISLTKAGNIVATSVDINCYKSMFKGCISLTQTPELHATTLASGCYENMFEGCTSLQNAPELPATELAELCYCRMFLGCSSLNNVKLVYTGTVTEAPSGAFTNWVSDVAENGSFYYTGSDPDPITNFGFPEGWQLNPEINY